MNKALLFLVFISFHSIANFSGHWVNENNTQSLTLDLIESGAHLTGKYCFITNNGNRVDCADGNERNIKGAVKNNIGLVSFESTFGGIGMATISIEKDTLKYNITDYTPFINANMSVPKVIFFKQKSQASRIEYSADEKYDADITISSPIGGGGVTFSQKKNGENYEDNSWGKILFSNKTYSADLSRDDRFYIEDGSSKVSPSGKYLIVNSVSGGTVEFGDGTSKYTERAYCSVVDMSNGCIVSDWDGEACGYRWVGSKDVLASSEDLNADKFDFQSMRPMINKTIDDFSGIDEKEVDNMLRCDSPSKENINTYQRMAKENKSAKEIVSKSISGYLNGITTKSTLKVKSNLFTLPNDNNKTSAYLVPGDKVRIIQMSPDNKWVNIGYINKKGSPLISWVRAEMLE